MSYETEKAVPTAILVGFTFRSKRDRRAMLDDPLAELRLLVESMGCEVAGEVFQRNMQPKERYLISAHLVELAKTEIKRTGTGASCLCVDDTLSGSQRANIEDQVECEVLDRTEAILQIFARRAHTSEGMLQVELAQLTYLLPRLRGRGGQELSALGGGIGTRGPGETKLETDRRVIRKRISLLKRKIEVVRKRRATQRKKRRQSGVPVIALVGYTNAGKTTLLNALSGADAYADDRLFATLDPVTRKAYAPPIEREILVTDTVGFIDRLPTELVAAFRATLEEALFADLLVLVVDGSEPEWERKLEVVEQTVEDIGAGEMPRLLVFSKADLYGETVGNPIDADEDEDPDDTITIGDAPVMDGVRVSALKGTGLSDFWDAVGEELAL